MDANQIMRAQQLISRASALCAKASDKQGGAVSAVNGTIKSLYACESCGAPFLWVRDVIQRPQDGQA